MRVARRRWTKWLSGIAPAQLIFLDETGAKTNMTRRFARARRGQRAVEHAPQGHWNTTTLVAAISSRGPLAPLVLDGPMDRVSFEAYVEQALAPALPQGAIVVMDNLSAHRGPRVEQLLRAVGAELRYLPAYSPDLNPIELMWSKIKQALRSAKARTHEALWEAIASALAQVTSQQCLAFFCHCGVGIKS